MLKNNLESGLKPMNSPGASGLLFTHLPTPALHLSFLTVDKHLSVGYLYNLLLHLYVWLISSPHDSEFSKFTTYWGKAFAFVCLKLDKESLCWDWG